MAIPSHTDLLRTRLEELESWAARSDAILLPGDFEDPTGVPTLSYRQSEPEDWSEFLEALERLRVKVIAVDARKMDQADWDYAQESATEAESSPAQELVMGALQDCKPCIGEIALLDVHAYAMEPPLIVRWFEARDWYNVVFAVEDELDDDEDFSEEDEAASDWPSERVERVAREVAEQPQFQRASNMSHRGYAVRKFLGDDAPEDDYIIDCIAREAANIFQMEIVPKQEEALAAKAKELASQGMRPREIADELGITLPRARRILK